MNKDYFIQLYTYNDWANRQVWDCVMKANDEDYFKGNSYSIGSLYTQLWHTMAVEQWWLGYLASGEVSFMTDEDKERLKDRDLLRQEWDAVNQRNIDYIHSLTDETLQNTVVVPFWDDDYPPILVSQALAQVANHSTDHRAQTMAVLHMYGYEGVGQDILTYLRETAAKTIG